MLSAISCGGELSFDRAGKPRSLQAAEGSVGGIWYWLILHEDQIIRTILRFSPC